MPAAQLGSHTLHYSDEGPKDGEVLVFANSLGTDFRIWDALLPLLPGSFRRIRYDKAGHGLSDCAGERPMAAHAGDLAGLLDHLGVKGAVIVGLSIGGAIAQALAAARPELTRALVLMDTGHRLGTRELWQQRIDLVRDGGMAAIADATMERWFSAAFRTGRSADLALWRNMLTRTPVPGYLACCAALRDADLTESTRQLKLPALCLVGAEDAASPPALVRELASLIDGARFEEIAAAGHLPCIEQPEAVARAVSRFFEQAGLV